MQLFDNIDAEMSLIQQAFQDVFRHRKYILGPEVEKLEHVMARWLQTNYAIGCNSGFGANLLSMFSLNLKTGGQIVVPAFAPSDDVGLLLRQNLTPVLVDITPDNFQMDATELSSRVNDAIDAIIVYHLFGGTSDMHTIVELAGDIPIVEVLTYSLGARIGDRYAGTFGTLATTCLLTTLGAYGDAGMIWTNESRLVEKIRKIRSENSKTDVYEGTTSGNFHQDTIHAAILLRKFGYWQKTMRQKSKQVGLFAQAILDREVHEVVVPEFYSRYATYLVVFAERRGELIAYLQKQGVIATAWWPIPIHLQPGFQHLGYTKGDFPQAERAAAMSLELPIPQTEGEINYLIDSLVNFYLR